MVPWQALGCFLGAEGGGGGGAEAQCPIISVEGFDSRARGSFACDLEGEEGLVGSLSGGDLGRFDLGLGIGLGIGIGSELGLGARSETVPRLG